MEAETESGIGPEGTDCVKDVVAEGETCAPEECPDELLLADGNLTGGAVGLSEREDVGATRIAELPTADGLAVGVEALYVGAFEAGDVGEGHASVDEREEHHVDGDGVVGDAVCGVFGETESSLEYFLRDSPFPVGVAEGLEPSLEGTEVIGGGCDAGFDCPVVEG